MKVRINDLARELEVKSKVILDVLPEVGITEEKTHSSPLSIEEADRVRKHFQSRDDGQAPAAPSPQPVPDAIGTNSDLSHISEPGDVLTAVPQKQQGQREIVVCMHCRLRQFVTSNGMCRRCRKSPHPSPVPPSLALKSDLPPGLPQTSRPVPGYPIYRRATSTVPRVGTSSAPFKAHITRIPSPRVIMPQTGPRPIYTAKATLNGVKRETATLAKSEQKSAHQSAIEQAEEALKAMRTQEKQS